MKSTPIPPYLALSFALALSLGTAAPAGAAEGGPTPAAESVTPVAEVRRGQHVVLRGEVERLLDDDEFRLTDATGSIRVYIGWRNRMPVQPGDRVTVHGVADDDVFPGLRPEVYAHRIERDDGSAVMLRGD